MARAMMRRCRATLSSRRLASVRSGGGQRAEGMAGSGEREGAGCCFTIHQHHQRRATAQIALPAANLRTLTTRPIHHPVHHRYCTTRLPLPGADLSIRG